jgi:transposase
LSTGRRVRRWRTASEKLAIVQLTLRPGASVAEVARAQGVNANQVFTRRRAFERGELSESYAALIPVSVSNFHDRSRESEAVGTAAGGSIHIELPGETGAALTIRDRCCRAGIRPVDRASASSHRTSFRASICSSSIRGCRRWISARRSFPVLAGDETRQHSTPADTRSQAAPRRPARAHTFKPADCAARWSPRASRRGSRHHARPRLKRMPRSHAQPGEGQDGSDASH